VGERGTGGSGSSNGRDHTILMAKHDIPATGANRRGVLIPVFLTDMKFRN
jgi:hypothetical protein